MTQLIMLNSCAQWPARIIAACTCLSYLPCVFLSLALWSTECFTGPPFGLQSSGQACYATNTLGAKCKAASQECIAQKPC